MEENTLDKDLILDTCLELAAQSSWSSLRFFDVADKLGVKLAEIQSLVRQKDDVAELLFDRADAAMMDSVNSEEFYDLPVKNRLFIVITAWLDALAPHKSIVVDIMKYKLEFGHVHLQAHGVTRVSRTVQWFMEAAKLNTTGLRRTVEEVVITSIYLKTFAAWLLEPENNHEKSKETLKNLLNRSESAADWLN